MSDPLRRLLMTRVRCAWLERISIRPSNGGHAAQSKAGRMTGSQVSDIPFWNTQQRQVAAWPLESWHIGWHGQSAQWHQQAAGRAPAQKEMTPTAAVEGTRQGSVAPGSMPDTNSSGSVHQQWGRRAPGTKQSTSAQSQGTRQVLARGRQTAPVVGGRHQRLRAVVVFLCGSSTKVARQRIKRWIGVRALAAGGTASWRSVWIKHQRVARQWIEHQCAWQGPTVGTRGSGQGTRDIGKGTSNQE